MDITEEQKDQEKAGWSFHKEGEDPDAAPHSEMPVADMQPISWTASEYISHQKDAGWYLILAGATAVVCALTYWISHGDLISIISIAVVGGLFGFLAGKSPRSLQYAVDSQGITVGQKSYPYSQFKSFAVIHEGPLTSINLWPLQRFMPELSIYCPPDQEEKILDFLSEHLPNDQRAEHAIDRLMKRIRF